MKDEGGTGRMSRGVLTICGNNCGAPRNTHDTMDKNLSTEIDGILDKGARGG